MNNVKKILGYIGTAFIGFFLCILAKFGRSLLSDGNGTDGIREHNKNTEEAVTRADERIRSAEKRSSNIMAGLADSAERLSNSTEQLERAEEIITDVRKRGKKKND